MNLIHNLPESVSMHKAILLYAMVAFFLFFEMAIQVSPSVMSTELMNDLNINTFGLGIMSGVYFYTYTAMQLPSGLLFDRFNPRIIITLSILTCAIGTLLFATAQNIYVGSLARLLMGAGSAFAFVSVLVVTADLFQPKYFAILTGITQMLAAFGAMSGQVPIRFLVSSVGWRYTLLILSLIALLLSIAVWSFLKYKKSVLMNHLSSQPNKSSLRQILSQPQTWIVALYSCMLWIPMSSFASLWGVPYLLKVNQLSPMSAAFVCSFMWIGLALASPLLGLFSTKLQKRVLPLIISALLGTFAFALFLKFDLSPSVLAVLLFLSGAACSGQALCFTVVKENNPVTVRGTAIAFNNIAVVISGALFQPLLGKLIEVSQMKNPHIFNISSFKMVFLAILGAYLLASLLAIFLIKEPKFLTEN